MLKENVTKAMHSAQFLTNEIRDAHTEADDLSGLILFDLINSSIKIKNRLEQLHRAICKVGFNHNDSSNYTYEIYAADFTHRAGWYPSKNTAEQTE